MLLLLGWYLRWSWPGDRRLAWLQPPLLPYLPPLQPLRPSWGVAAV